MPAAFDMSLIGDKKLKAAFAELERIDQRKVMRQSQRAAFKPVLKRIKAVVPRASGDLRRGIKLRALKRSRVRSGVYIRTPTRAELGLAEAAKGMNVDVEGKKLWYYPAHIETGYTDRHGNHVAAKPYMRGSFDGLRDRAWRKFHVMLWRGVKEVWGRAK